MTHKLLMKHKIPFLREVVSRAVDSTGPGRPLGITGRYQTGLHLAGGMDGRDALMLHGSDTFATAHSRGRVGGIAE